MKLFVGLGNSGAKYARHRHNVGFMAVDRIAEHLDLGAWRRRFQGQIVEANLGGERVILLKPTTYMNESGRAVGEAQRFFKIPIGDVYVFYDEIDLAPGRLKVKTGGGNAGHKGLSSITAHIGNDYRRVRIGVGHPGVKEEVPHYVLHDFSKVEYEWLNRLLDAIADSAGTLLAQDESEHFLNLVGRLKCERKAATENEALPKAQRAMPRRLKSSTKAPQRFQGGGSLLASPEKWSRLFRTASREVPRALKSELKRNYARFRRSRSKAKYIAVTGSSAKSTTVALLSHILSATAKVKFQVQRDSHDVTLKTLATVRREHDYVVLELGTFRPGDIPKMARAVKPDIAIITLVGLEHYSAFRSKDAVAKEKSSLVEVLPRSGIAILNEDDPRVFAMSNLTTARVVTFGDTGADYSLDRLISTGPGHLAFTLNHRDQQFELKTRLSGAHNRLAVSAAAACALELGIPKATVIERVASFEPVFGRLSVHAIDGGPTFILDTCKAPYETIPLALEVLRDSIAPRKRFVLGHISDYGGSSAPKYRDIYRAARDVADQVIFVGENAHRAKATSDEVEAGKFIAFSSVEELSNYVKSTAVAGENILLKGSQNLHLERVMLGWTTEIRCWPNDCGYGSDCMMCGLYSAPFSEHRGYRTKSRGGRWERLKSWR